MPCPDGIPYEVFNCIPSIEEYSQSFLNPLSAQVSDSVSIIVLHSIHCILHILQSQSELDAIITTTMFQIIGMFTTMNKYLQSYM